MKLLELKRTSAEYDAEAMLRAQDLFEGGERFRKNVKAYLPQHDVEPLAVYRKRCESAHYVNHAGSIGGYLASFLFSKPLQFDGGNEAFWGEFKEDCDGLGTDLDNFMRLRFIEALQKQRAYIGLEFKAPSAPVASLADFKAQGLDRASLRAIPTENIIAWQKDARGRYVWMRECSMETSIETTGADPVTTLTFTEWRQDGKHRRWETSYNAKTPPSDSSDIPEVEAPFDPSGSIPIVSLELPADLWLMGHLGSPQLAYFRLYAALLWAYQRSCYTMPVFYLEDQKKPPVMGTGYYLMLGKDEKAEWIAPPVGPYDSIKASLDGLKDEIYRVSQTMGRGVNNNAAAVGRSGESKQADDRATEIVIDAYAELVKEAATYVVNLIAKVASEEAPVVHGMTDYVVIDVKATMEAAMLVKEMGIPSVTFHQRMMEQTVAAFLPKLDEETRQKIVKEIEAGVTPESIDPMNQPGMQPIQPLDKNTPPGGAEAEAA